MSRLDTEMYLPGDALRPGINVSWANLPDVKTARDIWKYGSLFLLVLGTVGNLLTVCVMLRPRLRQSTTSLYLVALAFSDTLVLYTGLLRQWIRETFDVDVRTSDHASCVINLLLVYFATHLSSWILVCVTIERFVTVFKPLRAKLLCTRSVAGATLGLIGIVLFVINCHFLWDYKMVEGRCENSQESHDFFHWVWPWLHLALSCLAPFLLMVTMNAAMIIQVCVHNRKRKANGGSGRSSFIKTGSMSAVLIVITSVFILTTLPLNIHMAWINIVTYNGEPSALDVARYNLMYTAFAMVYYTNNSVNFLLYCVSGKKFRFEFLRMLQAKTGRVEPLGAPHTLEINVKT